MRPPKLNAIRMFEAAGRHLNFRVAAEELNLTQGAVAQAVRGLESDLDANLFRRLARGLAFTNVGRDYHADVTRGLAIIDQATKLLQPHVNTVAVSVPPSFASKWLVPRLPLFVEAYPNIEVRIFASETVTDFRAQDVDVAVRQGTRPPDQGLFVEFLAPLDLCALCSPSAKFSVSQVNHVEDFLDSPLIQDAHRHWEKLFVEADVESPSQFLQFNQTALAMDAAANGQGIAIAPRLLARNDIESSRLIEVWRDGRPQTTGFWLVHPLAEVTNGRARHVLVDWLISEGKQSNPMP